MGLIKNGLKKILPPPVNSFIREINRVVELEESNQIMLQQLLEKVEQQEQKINDQKEQLQLQNNILQKQEEKLYYQTQKIEQQEIQLKQQNEQFSCQEKQLHKVLDQKEEKQVQLFEQLKEQHNNIKKDISATRNHAWQSQQNTKELLWADIFQSITLNSTWLKNKSFSAGRWAVGYQYLYVVYRIMNEVQPKKILELGLGQSTRLLGQYATCYKDVVHSIIEHDSSWIEFFQQDFQLTENSKIIQLEREYKTFREDDHVLAFSNFRETLMNQKFDFISIDAPLGGEAVVYARVDILDLIPKCLEESFIIVMDDFNRQGEKNTIAVLEEKLEMSNIVYVKGIYSGQKDCLVICSEDLKFVCSM